VANRRPSAPTGLDLAGRAFWRQVVGEYELNPAELVLLGEACRTVDTLAAVAAAMDGVPLTTTGSTGQMVAHPLLAEARAQRRVLDQLCRPWRCLCRMSGSGGVAPRRRVRRR
jgi:hypothetical protein